MGEEVGQHPFELNHTERIHESGRQNQHWSLAGAERSGVRDLIDQDRQRGQRHSHRDAQSFKKRLHSGELALLKGACANRSHYRSGGLSAQDKKEAPCDHQKDRYRRRQREGHRHQRGKDAHTKRDERVGPCPPSLIRGSLSVH